MKTGGTIDRMLQAADALQSAASALKYGRHHTFIEELTTASHLTTEVIYNSEKLTSAERNKLIMDLSGG
jgi:hypothetical protein